MPDEAGMEDFDVGTPWRREASEIGPALEKWAAQTLGEVVRVEDVSAPGNGMSSETVLFTLRRANGNGEDYAARLAPLPELYPVFPTYDLALQKKCMDLVRARTDVPAPEVRWIEDDPQWVGTPFLVMKRIEGVVPPDMPPYVFGGWVLDATPDARAQLQRSSVSVLARLHELNPDNADLSFLAKPDRGASAMDQQLGHERWYYEWAREGETYPLIERTFEWLDAHRPPEGPTVFNWGDARIGNMLYRDFEPVAVLDWEMATMGPAEVDLAWMIFLDRFFDELALRYEMQPIPGFMERDDMVATYEELSGRTVEHLDWFEVFAALRFSIVSVRTTARGIAYGSQEPITDPDDAIMFRPLVEQMLDGTYWH